MSQNRQPKGVPNGGEFAGNQHAESKIYIGVTQQMKPVQGQLARSGDENISGSEAGELWSLANGRMDVQSGAFEQLAFNAGQNLAQNRATPAEVLHDMVVQRDKEGRQITRAWFMDKLPMSDPLQSVINHPNTSAETLYVIAGSSGHQPQSDAAKRRLREMRRGAPLRERFRLFTEKRKAARRVLPGKN